MIKKDLETTVTNQARTINDLNDEVAALNREKKLIAGGIAEANKEKEHYMHLVGRLKICIEARLAMLNPQNTGYNPRRRIDDAMLGHSMPEASGEERLLNHFAEILNCMSPADEEAGMIRRAR